MRCILYDGNDFKLISKKDLKSRNKLKRVVKHTHRIIFLRDTLVF